MASKSVVMMCLVLVLVFINMCNEAKAQSSCTSTLMGLSPCLSYVTGNSSTPSTACCSQLAAVIQSAPACLCSFMSSTGASIGISNINQTLAIALPQICNLQTPPVSQCNAVANGPASSPAALPSPAPAAASPESPTADASNPNPQTPTPAATTAPTTTTPTIPSGGGSKTVPTSTSDGNLTKPALLLFFLALASIFANV